MLFLSVNLSLFSCVLYLQVQSHSWVAHQPYIMQHPVSSNALIFIRTALSSTSDAILYSRYSFGSCARALRSSQHTECYFSCRFADTIKPAVPQTSPNSGGQSRGHFWEIPALYVCALEVIYVRGSMKEEWNNTNRHSETAAPRPRPLPPLGPPPPPPTLSPLPRSRSSRKCLKQTQSCDCFDSSSRWFPMEQVSLLICLLPRTLPGNDLFPAGVTFKGLHPIW